MTEPACGPQALCGWSPPQLAADRPLKRLVARLLPTTGVPVIAFFAGVVGLLLVAPLLGKPYELAVDGVAALAAGGWCALNFWLCRHAHCLVTGVGWLGLALFAFGEAVYGRSVIHGDEQLAFLGILVAGVAFELAWYLARGTNAVTGRAKTAS